MREQPEVLAGSPTVQRRPFQMTGRSETVSEQPALLIIAILSASCDRWSSGTDQSWICKLQVHFRMSVIVLWILSTCCVDGAWVDPKRLMDGRSGEMQHKTHVVSEVVHAAAAFAQRRLALNGSCLQILTRTVVKGDHVDIALGGQTFSHVNGQGGGGGRSSGLRPSTPRLVAACCGVQGVVSLVWHHISSFHSRRTEKMPSMFGGHRPRGDEWEGAHLRRTKRFCTSFPREVLSSCIMALCTGRVHMFWVGHVGRRAWSCVTVRGCGRKSMDKCCLVACHASSG